eukprot:3340062-Rhodomonas_salina.1
MARIAACSRVALVDVRTRHASKLFIHTPPPCKACTRETAIRVVAYCVAIAVVLALATLVDIRAENSTVVGFPPHIARTNERPICIAAQGALRIAVVDFPVAL